MPESLRLNFWRAPLSKLPPLFRVVTICVQRQFLAMNANCLLAELLCILVDQLILTTELYIAESEGFAFLLVETQVAHFTSVQSLLCILNNPNVVLKSFKVCQILLFPRFNELLHSLINWAPHILQTRCAHSILGVLANIGQVRRSSLIYSPLSLLLLD